MGEGKSGRDTADVSYDAVLYADSESLSIEIMKGLYPDMLSPNTRDDISGWWRLYDRTTRKVVPTDEWDYNEEEGKVTIKQFRSMSIL